MSIVDFDFAHIIKVISIRKGMWERAHESQSTQ